MRWSADNEIGSAGAATTASPSTTGRTRTAPKPRIAACGGTTIGVAKRPPSVPKLVTVKVAPRMVSGLR